MQIYADVLGKEINVAQSSLTGSLGSAVYAAAATGAYPSIEAAAAALVKPSDKVYTPIPENVEAYASLFKKYRALHDHFAKNKI